MILVHCEVKLLFAVDSVHHSTLFTHNLQEPLNSVAQGPTQWIIVEDNLCLRQHMLQVHVLPLGTDPYPALLHISNPKYTNVS